MSGQVDGKRLSWRRVAVAVVAAVVAGPLAMQAAPAWAAESETEQRTGAAAAAAASIPVDESGKLPALKMNEATGDFLNLGYDQRAALESPQSSQDPHEQFTIKLRIYDAQGKQLKEKTLDLRDWSLDGNPDAFANQKWAVDADLHGMKIAAGKDGHIFIAGRAGKWPWGSDDRFQAHVMKIDARSDGMAVVSDITLSQVEIKGISHSLYPVVTALDVGIVNGVETVAVGRSASGVVFYRASDMASQGAMFEDWNRGAHLTWGRDLVSALKFSDEGGVKNNSNENITGLAVGRLALDSNSETTHSVYMADPAAKASIWQQVETAKFGSGNIAAPSAFAFDKKAGRVAVSWWKEKNASMLLETRNQNTGTVDQTTAETIKPAARLSYVQAGTGNNNSLVVGSRDSQKNRLLELGATGKLEAVQLHRDTAESEEDLTAADDDFMRRWFPGYKSTRLSVVNKTGKALEARLRSSDASERGCWANVAVGDRQPFPDSAFSPIAVDSHSAEFASAVLTAGPAGACGPEDRRFAYVEIQPVGEPGLRSILKLEQVGNQLEVSKNQVPVGGGALKVEQEHSMGVGLGENRLVVSAVGAPEAVRAPTVEAKRLTTASPDGDAGRPVYRFDVDNVAWKVPGANADLAETQLSALTVQGSTNGLVWEDLGMVKPVTAPTLEGDDTIKLGKSSFYWENEKDAKQYTKIRVTSGSKISEPVTLANLAAPSNIRSGLSITLANAGVAKLRANGLDQQPVEVTLREGGNGPALDKGAEEYNLLHYRDAFNKLITGIIDPSRPEQLTSVTGYRGSYSNDGDSSSSRFRSYISTTSTLGQKVLAHLEGAKSSGQLAVTGSPAKPIVNTKDGISVTNCVVNCEISDANSGPVLFQPLNARSMDMGIILRAQAINGSKSLPLQRPDFLGNKETLANSGVEILGATVARIKDATSMSVAHGAIVTHGDYVELVDAPTK